MWIARFLDNRKLVLGGFGVLAIISGLLLLNLKFSFSFEQFFPKGDKDLEFFNTFIEEFETDDNFLLVAIEGAPDIFNKDFLTKLDLLKEDLTTLPYVTGAQAITDIAIPDFSTFPPKNQPILNRESDAILKSQKADFLKDERFVYNIVNETGTSTVIQLKTVDNLDIEPSIELMSALETTLDKHNIKDRYILGRAYFQDKLSEMQKYEVIKSSFISIILVSFILLLIYRQWIGVMIALTSIGLGLLLFMGLLSLLGRELNAMSAFYPVLMLIVGTSDIIHIMTKYLDELKTGKNKFDSISITIKEIGLATLLTSLTTSAGFLSLVSSKVLPIRDFGINSAIGVMVAYFTVIFFSTALLSFFKTDQLIKKQSDNGILDRFTNAMYRSSKNHLYIKIGVVLFAFMSVWGMSKITTNYKIESNMPRGEKITEDFFYFEREYGGFRPFEFAIIAQGDYMADDIEVITEVDKVERMLKSSGYIKTMVSPTTIYKSINQLFSIDKTYTLPTDTVAYNQIKNLTRNLEIPGQAILFNKNRDKTRISSRINDLGAESIKAFGAEIDTWISENTDQSVVEIKRTGTGLLLDKNSIYIRDSLLYGLGMALILVSLLMGLLFKNMKMVLISLIPNMLPLIFAAAVLGWVGIELEAGISIVFAIVFGIAVDDTIHFLSKYKLCRQKNISQEESIKITFLETGKAITITSIILFFGFLIMLFSIHPPSITIGLLISITLFSALFSDLLIIPILLRYFKV